MRLKILLPSEVFLDIDDVSDVVVEGIEGSFGLLEHRRDCVAALKPGVMTYQSNAEGRVYVAIDEGVLVKAAGELLISVRRALKGHDLSQLRSSLEKEFLTNDDDEKASRSAMAKLEAGFLSRYEAIRHD